jgi:hypothetical protein
MSPTPPDRDRPKKKAARHPRPHQQPHEATPARPDEMTDEVIEFITAIDEYKRARGRPFPNWSEVLEIVKGLGYAKNA